LKNKYNKKLAEKEIKQKETEKRLTTMEEEIDNIDLKKNNLIEEERKVSFSLIFKYLDNEFKKIKNLILVLNKLLMNFKEKGGMEVIKGDLNTNALLSNLLFDSNIIDLQSGVNMNLLDEVTNSIINVR